MLDLHAEEHFSFPMQIINKSTLRQVERGETSLIHTQRKLACPLNKMDVKGDELSEEIFLC